MKQVTKKTLGVAALGAAFAAAGAGVASADTGQTLEMVGATAGQAVQTLPVAESTRSLPEGTSETLAAGQYTTGVAATELPKAVVDTLPKKNKGNLLGGLPAGGLPIGAIGS